MTELRTNQAPIIQHNSEELKQSPKWFMLVEWVGLASFCFFLFFLGHKTIEIAASLWYLFIPSILLSWILADFGGGVVHWAADTWGSPDVPILGAAVIRPFREHHIDQLAMTKHGFVETNASSTLAVLPIFIFCSFLPTGIEKPFVSFIFFNLFFISVFTLLTNQTHKWAHSKNSPKFVQFLQRKFIILNPKHHQIHHTAPFNKHYCITTGWSNHFLNSINFFPTCEKIITKYTGALPRRDDIGELAARAILEEQMQPVAGINDSSFGKIN